MKKLTLKGFSLIECIVALALIGITSLLIAQVYGSVAQMNKNNNRLNTSLVEQMKLAEREVTASGTDVTVTEKTASGSNGIKIDKKSTDSYSGSYSNSTTANNFKIVMTSDSATTNNTQQKASVKIYVLSPKDKVTVADANDVDKGNTYNMDQDVRYKFILPDT